MTDEPFRGVRTQTSNPSHETMPIAAVARAVAAELDDVLSVAGTGIQPDAADMRGEGKAVRGGTHTGAGRVIGVGHDVVDLAAFDEQLREPGSRMRGLFSVRELRQSRLRAAAKHDGESVHLAARWAGKEAVLKAWCDALGERPYPYTLDDFPWAGVEILDDSRGRPHVVLADPVAARFRDSLAGTSPDPSWRISLSHDGPVASAVVLLTV